MKGGQVVAAVVSGVADERAGETVLNSELVYLFYL